MKDSTSWASAGVPTQKPTWYYYSANQAPPNSWVCLCFISFEFGFCLILKFSFVNCRSNPVFLLSCFALRQTVSDGGKIPGFVSLKDSCIWDRDLPVCGWACDTVSPSNPSAAAVLSDPQWLTGAIACLWGTAHSHLSDEEVWFALRPIYHYTGQAMFRPFGYCCVAYSRIYNSSSFRLLWSICSWLCKQSCFPVNSQVVFSNQVSSFYSFPWSFDFETWSSICFLSSRFLITDSYSDYLHFVILNEIKSDYDLCFRSFCLNFFWIFVPDILHGRW